MPLENKIKDLQGLFQLNGKVAVVTGAAGALGRAISLGLATYGVDVVVCDLELPTLEELSGRIQGLGQKALPLRCDVTDPISIDRMVRDAINEFGEIHILFHSAGLALRQPAREMPLDHWQKVMDVNVKGTLACSTAVAGKMIEQGKGGSIITVGSVRGFRGDARTGPAYGTSKAAVHYLTKQLAAEWAKFDIRVNCIAPCIFWSPLTEPLLSDKENYKQSVANIPLGRAAVPEDFVGATIFLASDASAMVTGHVLSVDGGILIA